MIWLIQKFIFDIIQLLMTRSNWIIIVILLITHVLTEVVILDQTNITAFLQQHPYAFVNFYSTTCQHCQSMAPEFQKLAQLAQGKDYVIAKVDVLANQKIRQQFKIEKFPTLKYFANGSEIQYKNANARTAVKMQEWIENFFTIKISVINEEELQQKIGKESLLLVRGGNAQQMKVLEIASFVDQSVDYYHLEAEEFKITLYYHGKHSKVINYGDQLSIQNLTKWTYLNTLSSLIPINSQQALRTVFTNSQKIPVFLLYKADDLSQQILQKIQEVCYENRFDFKCGYIDNSVPIFKKTAKYLKLKDETASALAYLQYGLKKGFLFPNLNEFSNSTIFNFYLDIREGKLQSFIDAKKSTKTDESAKSQKIQYVNVVKLTSQTYKSVLQENKYVFIEYYSSTCGHCIQFAPQYEKLASRVKSDGLNYIIAAVDIPSEAEIKKIANVQKFPTFRFYSNGKQIDYPGQRDIEQMLKFMNKAADTKLLTAPSIINIPKPSIAIYGIAKDSPLQLLPLFYTRFPIYHIQGDHKFKIEVYNDREFSVFQEKDAELNVIVDWIEDMTQPIIVGIADEQNSRKLTQGIQKQYPLLVVVDRDSSAKKALKILQKYCLIKYQIVCGKVSRSDFNYASFNEWLSDDDPDKSVVVMIDTVEWKNYMHVGDLNELTEKRLDQFVEAVILRLKKKDQRATSGKNDQVIKNKPKQKVQKNKKGRMEPLTEIIDEQL